MPSDLDHLKLHLDVLPIFPLPSGVLLPYEMLPLHVFEPRYRQMIADVRKDGRPLALAQLAAGWEENYEGRPPVEPICGVGVVTRFESLPDGRANILLRGVARVQIIEELAPRQPYREVKAQLLDDGTSTRSEAQLAADMDSLRRMLFALCADRPIPAAGGLAQLAAGARTPASLADIVTAAVLTNTEARRDALRMLDAGDRLQVAQNAVANLLVGIAEPPESRLWN